MRRALIIGLALAIVTACGGGSATTPAVTTGSIHVSGGIGGLDETWSLGPGGVVTGPEGESGTLDVSLLDDISAAAESAAFFGLASEYLPADPCCDRFTYELTLSGEGRSHTVTTMDGADAPAGLFALIDVFWGTLREAG